MPKYTKTQRQNLVKVFEAAKLFLWDGSNSSYGIKKEYICHAIERTNLPGAHMAKLLVMRRLDGYYTFYNWLVRHGVSSFAITETRMQAHRLAWLNLLIEEFSK